MPPLSPAVGLSAEEAISAGAAGGRSPRRISRPSWLCFHVDPANEVNPGGILHTDKPSWSAPPSHRLSGQQGRGGEISAGRCQALRQRIKGSHFEGTCVACLCPRIYLPFMGDRSPSNTQGTSPEFISLLQQARWWCGQEGSAMPQPQGSVDISRQDSHRRTQRWEPGSTGWYQMHWPCPPKPRENSVCQYHEWLSQPLIVNTCMQGLCTRPPMQGSCTR